MVVGPSVNLPLATGFGNLAAPKTPHRHCAFGKCRWDRGRVLVRLLAFSPRRSVKPCNLLRPAASAAKHCLQALTTLHLRPRSVVHARLPDLIDSAVKLG